MINLVSKILFLTFFYFVLCPVSFKKMRSVEISSENLRYSYSQKFLAAYDYKDGQYQLRIYDGHSLDQIQIISFNGTDYPPHTVEFSHNQNLLAITHTGGNIYIYGRQGRAFTKVPIWNRTVSGESQAHKIAFSNDDTKIAVGDSKQVISIINNPTNNGGLVMQQQGHLFTGQQINCGFTINDIVFTPQGNLLVGGSTTQKEGYSSGIMKFFDASNNWTEIRVLRHPQIIYSLAYANDSSFFLSAGFNDSLTPSAVIWNGKNFTNMGVLQITVNMSFINHLQISNNMLYIVASSYQPQSKTIIWQRFDTKYQFRNESMMIQHQKYDNPAQIKQAFSKKGGTILVLSPEGQKIDEYSLCSKGVFYWQDKDICQYCRLQCIECFGNQINQCMACNITAINGLDPIPLDGRCLCLDRARFVNDISNACTLCTDYVDFCIRCDGPYQCTACNQTFQLVGGKCICPKKYFYNTTTIRCDPCSIDGCLKCSDTTNCTICDKDSYWINDSSGKCLCTDRYLNVNGVCQSCERGCLQCTPTVDRCVQCDEENKFNDTHLDFKCQCIDGTQFDGNNTCVTRENYTWLIVLITIAGLLLLGFIISCILCARYFYRKRKAKYQADLDWINQQKQQRLLSMQYQ